jgi:hypothetical protein
VKKGDRTGLYSEENLRRAAHTLNYRQLDMLHEHGIQYPENHCEEFRVELIGSQPYLIGSIFLSDKQLIGEVESGSIYAVSAEYIFNKRLNRLFYYSSLALVRRPREPAEPNALIITR